LCCCAAAAVATATAAGLAYKFRPRATYFAPASGMTNTYNNFSSPTAPSDLPVVSELCDSAAECSCRSSSRRSRRSRSSRGAVNVPHRAAANFCNDTNVTNTYKHPYVRPGPRGTCARERHHASTGALASRSFHTNGIPATLQLLFPCSTARALVPIASACYRAVAEHVESRNQPQRLQTPHSGRRGHFGSEHHRIQRPAARPAHCKWKRQRDVAAGEDDLEDGKRPD